MAHDFLFSWKWKKKYVYVYIMTKSDNHTLYGAISLSSGTEHIILKPMAFSNSWCYMSKFIRIKYPENQTKDRVFKKCSTNKCMKNFFALFLNRYLYIWFKRILWVWFEHSPHSSRITHLDLSDKIFYRKITENMRFNEATNKIAF